jgi:plastocyanin
MKTTISLVVIVLIVFGGFFLFKGDSNQELEESTDLDTTMAVPAPGNEEVPSSADTAGQGDETMVNDEPNISDVEGFEAPSFKLVEYTDAGFSPNQIEIVAGETIRFVNGSSGNMWVGSAMHPTHNNYPEKTENDCLGSAFDQCQSVGNGDFWEFTFNVAGEHGYHNHADSSKWGRVIVN